jgi:hypothetical protein
LACGIEYLLIARNPIANNFGSVPNGSTARGVSLDGGGGNTNGRHHHVGRGEGRFNHSHEDVIEDGNDDDDDDEDDDFRRRHDAMGIRSTKRGVLRRGGRLLWHGCSPEDVVEVRIRLLGIRDAANSNSGSSKRGGFGLGFGSGWSSRLYLRPQNAVGSDDGLNARQRRERLWVRGVRGRFQ